MELAPICLFTYNRLDETKRTIRALRKNNLAEQSEVFVFSDGAKEGVSDAKIKEVREFLKNVTGFKKFTIKESPINKGLANSIIDGVSEVICKYGNVIVLEDDLITAPNYLNFMNEALNFYKNNVSIFSISGYSMNLPSLNNLNKDYYLGVRASSWGWGTWSRSWTDIDWEVKDYDKFSTSVPLRKMFRRGGSDMPRMLDNQMNKKIDSWAIRWCYNQFKRGQYTVYPKVSKIESIGFGGAATHTKKTKRFDTYLDVTNQSSFNFDEKCQIDNTLIKEFKNKFSIFSRFKDKLL